MRWRAKKEEVDMNRKTMIAVAVQLT